MGAVILLLAALSGWTALAGSDDQRARELYDNGVVLYEEGRYEDAVVAFEEAYRLSGRPALLFNIANALERAGRWNDALDVLSRYRAYAPADERETLDRRITNLERRIAEQGAKPAAPAPVPTPAAPSPVASAAPKSSAWLAPAPLALLGGGTVALGVGTALGLSAAAAHEEALGLCSTDGSGSLRCGTEAADPLAREQGSALAADVLFGVGIAAVGAGVVVGVLGGPVSVGPGTLTFHGEF